VLSTVDSGLANLIHDHCSVKQGSSERSERSVRFEPNVRSERVRYFSERETNVQAFKHLIS